MEREHIDATLILSNPLTFPNRVEMTASALRHHIPTMVSQCGCGHFNTVREGKWV